MNVAVRSNVRTAEAAREGSQPAFQRRVQRGLGDGPPRRRPRAPRRRGLLLGAHRTGSATRPDSAVDDLIGLAFGGSLISVFARLGGGIYTKAADVGADLVGKIEAGIPEDDPRNPAVIADNVGDNVGDCAGMAADLFETYAVTAVAVMLLGIGFDQQELWLYPLALGGISILASVIGTFFARVGSGPNAIINALYRSVLVATILSALGFIPVTMAYDGGEFGFWNLYGSALIGLARDVPARRDHRVLHRHALESREADREGLADGARDEHHRGARRRHAGDGAARARDRDQHRRRVLRGGRVAVRDRRRGHGAAVDDRPHRRPRRLRPGDGQRRRHRRDGRPAGVRARDHRSRSTPSATRRRP